MSQFEQELTSLLNKHNQENGSDTPDYILARYLTGCLRLFNATIIQRSGWYGQHDFPGRRMSTDATTPTRKPEGDA